MVDIDPLGFAFPVPTVSAAGKILRKDLRERAKKEMKEVGAKL